MSKGATLLRNLVSIQILWQRKVCKKCVIYLQILGLWNLIGKNEKMMLIESFLRMVEKLHNSLGVYENGTCTCWSLKMFRNGVQRESFDWNNFFENLLNKVL